MLIQEWTFSQVSEEEEASLSEVHTITQMKVQSLLSLEDDEIDNTAFYEALEISKDASQEEIKKQYR